MEQQVLTLRSVIDHADAVIFSVDRQYRYTSFNRTHAALMDALYGTTPRLGVSLLDCMTSAEDRDLARQNVDRALAGEALVQEAYSGEDPATRRYLRVSHSPIRDAAGAVVGAAVVAQDLTDRKRAEDALREEQRLFVGGPNVAFRWRAAAGWPVEYVSPNLQDQFGYAPDDLTSGRIPYADLVHPDDLARVAAEVASHSAAGVPCFEQEYRIRRADGEVRWVYDFTVVVRADGRITHYHGHIRDVTARHQGEEALRRLNRELVAISSCNQVLMHATDETALLNDVCRIICDEAGYRLAWVGYAEDDEARTIRPVAWAGHDDGYVAQARLTWADTDRGRGPAGVTVREGRTCWIEDFDACPEFAPWLVNARARGYRSGISLPLKDDQGRVLGVLLIYSLEVRATTPEEIRMMEELAGDLAFGITVLRARAERKRTERSLALMGFALDNVRESAFLIDRDARFQYVNQEACRSLGYERDALLRLRVDDVDPDFPPDRWAAHWDQLKAGRSMTFEGRHRARDGRVFPVEISANHFEYDGQEYNLALVRDITARRQAEEVLREREAFIRNILESVDEGFVVVDRDFRIRSANRAYCGMVSRAEPEVVGRTCHQVSHASDQPCDERGEDCPVRHMFATGTPQGASHVHVDPAGARTYLEIRSYPITDAAGTVVAAIETLNDVTERRKLEEQLRQSQKMEAIGQLAGGVAHDFNNLLTAIIGYSTLAKAKLGPDHPQAALIDQVLASSDRAANLTRGLLTFSRKQVLHPRPVDLNDIVRGMEKLLARLIGEDIRLVTRLAERGLIVMADAGQIEQVLMNLSTNARDAMPRGGTLCLATAETSLGPDVIAANGFGKPGRYAEVSVSDTGIGMDETTRGRLFEPFFTTKEPGKGTGLGLAIVYGIVQQHEGAIHVYSEPGKGSTFRIYLPLAVGAGDEATREAVPPPRGGSETLLLAEDDQDVRTLTSLVLREHGYRVVEAVDGEDALVKFAAHGGEIDLMVLDVVMPGKSGKDVFDAVRRTRPDLDALFISGYTADVIHRKGFFEEGLPFVSKPLSPFTLLRKVRELLDARRRRG